jgi:hypothetical protein
MLNATKLGLAGGIAWGVCLFLTTLLSVWTGYGKAFLEMVSSLYPWFGISIGGAFLGLIEGFIDGFVCLFVLAWLYNRFNKQQPQS